MRNHLVAIHPKVQLSREAAKVHNLSKQSLILCHRSDIDALKNMTHDLYRNFTIEVKHTWSGFQEMLFIKSRMPPRKLLERSVNTKDLSSFHLLVSLLEATRKSRYVFQVEWSRLNARNVD